MEESNIYVNFDYKTTYHSPKQLKSLIHFGTIYQII